MSGNGRTIYIAGAGIAGMTLALALAKFGATVVVIERQPRVQEVGAGLQISPNARKILARLGLGKAMAEIGFEPEGIDVYPYGAARPLTTLTLGETATRRFGAPYAVMHRADLAQALYRACRRFANIDLLFGVRSYDVVSHPRGVTVTIDEADGRSRSARGFAFIGADGVHSHTRRDILGGADARYSGMVAWRIALGMGALQDQVATERTSLLLGPGYHAVTYPLPHRKQMNVVLMTKLREADAFSAKPPSRPTLPWALRKDQRFAKLLEAGGDEWAFWPLNSVPPGPYHKAGIGLVGDAAHAMLPFQAQGAAMAIEDAAILAPLLMTEPDAAAALEGYERLRRPRVEKVQKLSARNGLAFHMEWPFTLGRDAVIAMQGPEGQLSRLAWLYGYDPAPDSADLRIGDTNMPVER